MVLLVEADLVGRPPEPVVVHALLCCRDISRQLLEVAIR
jgi:hypothetical protein